MMIQCNRASRFPVGHPCDRIQPLRVYVMSLCSLIDQSPSVILGTRSSILDTYGSSFSLSDWDPANLAVYM